MANYQKTSMAVLVALAVEDLLLHGKTSLFKALPEYTQSELLAQAPTVRQSFLKAPDKDKESFNA